MSFIDWTILVLTLLCIVLFGIWRSRGTNSLSGFLLADRQLPWYHVGLSVMATQASAITFLSAPGQAYTDGLRFIQFYFGLPLAMVVLCITFIPVFKRLNVYTAYEYLEKRFDNKTRTFTALLFLLQRGLSTGISIYAPSIVLSSILHIPTDYTTFFIGGIVILYTVYGGTKAVSYTQLLQMFVIFAGLFMSAWMVLRLLPEGTGLSDALHIAGKMGKTTAIDTQFDLNNRYNIWSGIIGGFFLQLSYFGTDQSQVGRYLTGSSIRESRLGLLMNGLVKIPMQFLILLTGTLVFVFYQYHTPPIFFNTVEAEQVKTSMYAGEYVQLEKQYATVQAQKQQQVKELADALRQGNEETIAAVQHTVQAIDREAEAIRKSAIALVEKNNPRADKSDTNYVFLTFVTTYFPQGLIGLLIAIIFLASMGSTASGLNSLASASIVDVYKRHFRKAGSERQDLSASRYATVFWGFFCIVTALYAGRLGNLIEAVNILGSFFYGTILGIFLVAFYMKNIRGTAVFYAAVLAETGVIIAWWFDWAAFLWLNVIGCLLVMGFAALIQQWNRQHQ